MQQFQLTIEIANAYKIASDRAEIIIQSLGSDRQILTRQVEQAKKTETSLRQDVTELQQQCANLQAQLGGLQITIDRQALDNVDTIDHMDIDL